MNWHESHHLFGESSASDKWGARLRRIVGTAQHVVEVEDENYSVIIRRVTYKSAQNDWAIEFRNPEIFPVKTDDYRLRSGVGLVYHRRKEADEYILHRDANGMSAQERFNFYSEAKDILDKVEGVFANSKLFLRDSKPADKQSIL